MPIRFPQADEIPLANPPLAEVVCQVRFPPILRIVKEEPADFQERVRDRFPQLDFQQDIKVKMPQPGSESAPEAAFSARIYRFRNLDENASISLAPDFYALSSHNYTRWEYFAEDLLLAHDTVRETYDPSHATRIGLRYINRLTLDNSGTSSLDELFDLLRPELTATLQGQVWKDAKNMISQLRFRDEGRGAQLNYTYGLDDSDGPTFLLDFDYFEEGKLPLEGLIERLDYYHNVIHNVFRWSVRAEALQRFRPIEAGVE